MAEAPSSIPDAIAWLGKAFCADAADGLQITYEFILSGPTGGTLWLRVDDGRLELGEGAAHGPDVVFTLEEKDFYAVLAGRENPDLLFMAERLRIEGDLALGLKLRRLFAASV